MNVAYSSQDSVVKHVDDADTPDELVSLLESILVECTSYQVAGQPMSKADSEQLEEEITQAVLQVSISITVALCFLR